MTVGRATAVSLTPQRGGLRLDVELDQVSVGMHLSYAVLCADGGRDVGVEPRRGVDGARDLGQLDPDAAQLLELDAVAPGREGRRPAVEVAELAIPRGARGRQGVDEAEDLGGGHAREGGPERERGQGRLLAGRDVEAHRQGRHPGDGGRGGVERARRPVTPEPPEADGEREAKRPWEGTRRRPVRASVREGRSKSAIQNSSKRTSIIQGLCTFSHLLVVKGPHVPHQTGGGP